MSIIKYTKPQNWIIYNESEVVEALSNAKAAVLSLRTVPYQKNWVEKLQHVQLKREIAGTSRIEGADFTDSELDEAMNQSPDELFTRSQNQARAARNTYTWISGLEDDMPLTVELIEQIHFKIIFGADDDHCPAGVLRRRDQNVTFGVPAHRGAEGGEEVSAMFHELIKAAQNEYREHDPLLAALALHYHFASIHPFIDGNGRTARAMEALQFQRLGLRDTAFIAMSNYYYDEKNTYLKTLSICRQKNHNLTDFMIFGLKGIELQCLRLLKEINSHIAKALYRNLMFDLFSKLKSSRKRVIAERQLEILKILLELDEIEWRELIERTEKHYEGLTNPFKALVRDVNQLGYLGSIIVIKKSEKSEESIVIKVNLKWPMQVSETDFIEKVKALPTAKTHSFL